MWPYLDTDTDLPMKWRKKGLDTKVQWSLIGGMEKWE